MTVRIPRRQLSREQAQAVSRGDRTSAAAVRARLLAKRARLEAGEAAAGAERASAERGQFRPPVGVPSRVREPNNSGRIAALLFHALLVLLIVSPFGAKLLVREIEGAGGPGPAGGGGGGNRGSGGAPERIQYTAVAPPPPPPPTVTPPVVPPIVPPVVPPPVVPPTPQPQPVVPTPAAVAPTAPVATAAAPTPGTGGGTGNDGSAGTGPGTGGGQGSGVGTGKGTSVGPGTGGGNGSVYPPQPTELFIPPLPVPGKVKGTQLVAVFDVDSTGKVLGFDFNETKDGAYNRKLRDVLGGIRFRPGVNGAGVPIRAQGSVTYIF
jgi:periplasmic protein TonB